MQITTVGKNKYSAMFNKRRLSITTDGDLKAVDTSTREIIEGAELRSIRNLVEWHVESKQDKSELVTLWTTR